jgi:hypothetical protein
MRVCRRNTRPKQTICENCDKRDPVSAWVEHISMSAFTGSTAELDTLAYLLVDLDLGLVCHLHD